MKKKKYSVIAGRGGNKLVKFMFVRFPFWFGLVCISFSILACIVVLSM